ncbi:MAG TPA: DUF4157 domain-containing protein [Flavisolibacter sp.]|jgi:hypothetical protein
MAKRSQRSRRNKKESAEEHQEQAPFFGRESVKADGQAAPAFFQAKFAVNTPNDAYEQEANAMAKLAVNGQPATGAQGGQKSSGVQKKDGGGAHAAPPNLSARIEQSAGKGQPLPEGTGSEMSNAFGTDFSNVSIHDDAEAAQMNQELGAQAFTHGNDIYFDSGRYDTSGTAGKELLAHELTHVVQQNAMQPAAPAVQRAPDTIPEANNQFYGHGAFMGAAPQLMADPKWNRILRSLMPDVHADATAALADGPNSPTLILMMENNPVMAAYGMYRTRQMDQNNENGRSDRVDKMQAIEWDVFLPTEIVEQYNDAETDEERARLAHEMVEEMIIAHGTLGQTLGENVLDRRQYGNVRGTRKSDQGGVRPGAWMDLFGRALRLATAVNWEDLADEFENPDLHPRVNSPDDQAADRTFQNQMSFTEVINMYKSMFGKETFSVLLDIKSRDATPTILGALVRDLNLRGVLVYGVGSFKHSELEGLSLNSQVVDGRTYAGPTEVRFYHLAGNLQEDCLRNRVRPGATVMFNAGSLVSFERSLSPDDTKASYAIKNNVVSQLETYKNHYGFHLGVYVQENDIDDRAATLITELTNSRPDLFDLGFAWGGLSGQTASDIEPGYYGRGRLGLAGQRLAGKDWDETKPRPGSEPGSGSGFSSTIRIQHRFLESRRFPVNAGTATLTSDAEWNMPGCLPDTYYATLVQERNNWFDKEKGSFGFPATGGSYSATWYDLESGTYYLQFWFSTDHDPACVLSGDVRVDT